MNQEAINQRLYELTSTKDFADLTEAERTFVRQHSDEAEYKRLRQTHQQLEAAEQGEQPTAPPLSSKMHKALARKRKSSSTVSKMLNFPIPIWQAAAMLIVVIGLFVLLGRQERSGAPIVVELADTLQVESLQFSAKWHQDTIVLTATPVKQTTTPPADTNLASNETTTPGNLPILTLDQKGQTRTYGKSMADDTLWEQFEIVSM